MVATDGAIDYMCWQVTLAVALFTANESRPDFDSPSVFCRMLDKDKGGHFAISPEKGSPCMTKQQYLPSSNILQTRYLSDEGVLNIVDFFPRPNEKPPKPHLRASGTLRVPSPVSNSASSSPARFPQDDPKHWLVRRVNCIRGSVKVAVELFPVSKPSVKTPGLINRLSTMRGTNTRRRFWMLNTTPMTAILLAISASASILRTFRSIWLQPLTVGSIMMNAQRLNSAKSPLRII
jgi:hypothetical protein